MEYVKAFIVGGIICILVQILMDNTKLQPGRIMVILVVSGAVLGALGIYEKIADFAGCGATVPLSGFGFSLWKGMKEAIDQHGVLGLFEGGFTAAAVGTSAALIFSYQEIAACLNLILSNAAQAAGLLFIYIKERF